MMQTVSFGSPSGLRRTGNGRTVIVVMRPEKPVTIGKELTSGSSGGEISVSASSGKPSVTDCASLPEGWTERNLSRSQATVRRVGKQVAKGDGLPEYRPDGRSPGLQGNYRNGVGSRTTPHRPIAGKPDHWFIALEEITGAQPIPPESEGKVKKMAEAWIKWWEEFRREHPEANR